MAGDLTDTGTQYGTSVGLVYIFNLIVGTGALTMPAAFKQAGWLVSLILIILLAFVSFLTVTFVMETMALANAVMRLKRRSSKDRNENDERASLLPGNKADSNIRYDGCHNGAAVSDDVDDSIQVINGQHGQQDNVPVGLFDITSRVEMGKMAEMFFNNVGEKLFYLCIIIYLYGDLSIYVAAVPKSIRDTACTWRPPANMTVCNETLSDSQPCWYSSTLTRMDAYRIFVACFIVTLGPFVFFNVQKTKYLQIATTLARWLAFGIMIVLAVIRLAQHKGEGHPVAADVSGVPNLFGVCVYSFMCHHSLPSLITPIRDKSKLYRVLAADYALILAFYALMSFTGIYTFSSIKDLYTLNFLPDECGNNAVTNVKFFQYFLALFPVFTLSTNFPIISITLRNNLQTLALKSDREYSSLVRNLFPLLAVIPPAIVGMATSQVEVLVGVTGSYAGTGIQYVIPALLVFYARKSSVLAGHVNNYKSPFGHNIWVILVISWSVLCVGFVTVNHIVTKK